MAGVLAQQTNLKAIYDKVSKSSDECKAAHSSENICNTDDECVWCVAHAIPSFCASVDDVEALAAFATCDKKDTTKLGKSSEECKAEHATEDACGSDTDCIWCPASAIKPFCGGVEDKEQLAPICNWSSLEAIHVTLGTLSATEKHEVRPGQPIIV